jgi:ferredoxin
MRVTVDPDICIGCTICTQICPEEYEMRGDKAAAITNPVPAGLQDKAKNAAEQCPVDAIKVEE